MTWVAEVLVYFSYLIYVKNCTLSHFLFGKSAQDKRLEQVIIFKKVYLLEQLVVSKCVVENHIVSVVPTSDFYLNPMIYPLIWLRKVKNIFEKFFYLMADPFLC